jgi:hypothetical protein
MHTLDRDYGYDDLGRRISLDVHFTSGELYQGWRHVYDDTAHTVSTTLDEPRGLRDDVSGGFTMTELDTYDGDGHWLASHTTFVDTPSGSSDTDDTVVTWDGDRELGTTDTFSGPGFSSKTITTFKYSCPNSRAAAGDLPASTQPRPAHRRTPHRQR